MNWRETIKQDTSRRGLNSNWGIYPIQVWKGELKQDFHEGEAQWRVFRNDRHFLLKVDNSIRESKHITWGRQTRPR